MYVEVQVYVCMYKQYSTVLYYVDNLPYQHSCRRGSSITRPNRSVCAYVCVFYNNIGALARVCVGFDQAQLCKLRERERAECKVQCSYILTHIHFYVFMLMLCGINIAITLCLFTVT